MTNYTQQCRSCHVHIEGTGEDICYRCLQRDRDALLEACQTVIRFLDALEVHLEPDDPLRKLRGQVHAPLRAQLEPAIAKATGETK